jgi:hypothetical protein
MVLTCQNGVKTFINSISSIARGNPPTSNAAISTVMKQAYGLAPISWI